MSKVTTSFYALEALSWRCKGSFEEEGHAPSFGRDGRFLHDVSTRVGRQFARSNEFKTVSLALNTLFSAPLLDCLREARSYLSVRVGCEEAEERGGKLEAREGGKGWRRLGLGSKKSRRRFVKRERVETPIHRKRFLFFLFVLASSLLLSVPSFSGAGIDEEKLLHARSLIPFFFPFARLSETCFSRRTKPELYSFDRRSFSLSLFLSLSLSLSSCLAVHLGSPPLVNRFFLSDALREVQRKEDERANEL